MKGHISAFNSVFVHMKYTSNMAACYVSVVNALVERLYRWLNSAVSVYWSAPQWRHLPPPTDWQCTIEYRNSGDHTRWSETLRRMPDWTECSVNVIWRRCAIASLRRPGIIRRRSKTPSSGRTSRWMLSAAS